MMKHFKLILTALLLCAIVAFTASCHGKREAKSFDIPESFDTEKQYEITFWAKNETNKNQTDAYNKAIADFEAIYPNIKVKIKHYTDYGRIYNDVVTNISTGTTPNICITYPDHIATYMKGDNVVVPLDGLMADARYGLGGSEVRFDSPKREEIVPKFLEECWINGYYYGMPFMRSTEALYINKTYVEAMGYEIPEVVTWDFVWEVSDAATAKNPDGTYAVNGQKVLIPFIYKSTDNMMIQMLKQKNAGYSTSRGDVLIFNDTTKEILYNVADHTKTGAFSTFKIDSYPANYMNKGQCLFAVDSTAGSTWFGADAPLSDIHSDQVVEFETVVRPVPQFDTESPKMISQGPSICLFNKEDEGEVLASWLFMQYLLTNGVQIAYSQTEGYLPVTEKAHNSAEYQDYLSRSGEDNDLYYSIKHDTVKLLLNNIENTFITPVFDGSTSLRDAAGQMIENVVKSIRRKETVNSSYMDRLFKEMTSLFKLDRIAIDGSVRMKFDGIPVASAILLGSIGAVWVGIITVFTVNMVKKSRK